MACGAENSSAWDENAAGEIQGRMLGSLGDTFGSRDGSFAA